MPFDAATYLFEGYNNNVLVLSQAGIIITDTSFLTYSNATPATTLDRLNISVSPGGGSSFNLDNIVVNRVIPEPSAFALLGLGTLAAGIVWRKRITRLH